MYEMNGKERVCVVIEGRKLILPLSKRTCSVVSCDLLSSLLNSYLCKLIVRRD